MKKNNLGMTLVELLVVVSIISILTFIITVYLRTQVFKANDARRKAEIKRIGIAVEEYEKDNNCYPLSNLVICKPGTGLLPYINKIPCDITTNGSYFYEHEESICPRWYRIYAKLENETDTDYQAGIGPGGAFNFVYPTSYVQPADFSEEPTNEPTNEPIIVDEFYGCFSGVCTQISWDYGRPGPECEPNWSNRDDCYNQCVNPDNRCLPWDR